MWRQLEADFAITITQPLTFRQRCPQCINLDSGGGTGCWVGGDPTASALRQEIKAVQVGLVVFRPKQLVHLFYLFVVCYSLANKFSVYSMTIGDGICKNFTRVAVYNLLDIARKTSYFSSSNKWIIACTSNAAERNNFLSTHGSCLHS